VKQTWEKICIEHSSELPKAPHYQFKYHNTLYGIYTHTYSALFNKLFTKFT